METVLLLEGLEGLGDCGCSDLSGTIRRKEGKKKMARVARRIRTSRGVRCQDSRGRFVKCSGTSGLGATRKRRSTRRRSFLGDLGQTGVLAQFQPQLVNGGLAAAGAWLSKSLGSKIGTMINVTPGSTTGNILTLAVGVLLAGVVGKVLKRPQFGVALGTGAVAITILDFIGTMTPTAGLGVLQAEAAPYYQRSAMPPLAQFQSLPAGAASVSNLYSDVGVAAVV